MTVSEGKDRICRKIEQVDATMDEIRDQMDVMKEIGDAISQPLGYGVDMDEVFQLILQNNHDC